MAPARILIVRLGAMGDILHALPAAAALRRTFPEAALSWVVHPKWRALLEGSPLAPRLLFFDRRRWSSLPAFWRALRAEPYDIAIDFQGLLQSAALAAISGARDVFGQDAALLRERPAALFYSRLVRTSAAHVVDRNLALAAAAGAASGPPEFPLPPGEPTGDLPEEPFVLASPLAGWPAKQWPIDHWAPLARLLAARGIPLVLDGSPTQQATLASVPGAIPHVSSIPGLIHATRRASAVVGLDSGPMHLAAALRRPGVALFGPTDPARNGPYSDTFFTLRSPAAKTTYKRGQAIDPSMAALTPQEVFEALCGLAAFA
jgi:heptosyltransferase-1